MSFAGPRGRESFWCSQAGGLREFSPDERAGEKFLDANVAIGWNGACCGRPGC